LPHFSSLAYLGLCDFCDVPVVEAEPLQGETGQTKSVGWIRVHKTTHLVGHVLLGVRDVVPTSIGA
jgi:hypothetical protein